ncbi:MAG: hypothetical protein K2J08_11385 [Ruminococcus sp.]|nr:hypothetical protein [Ruminococcus sp.]
MPVNNFYILDNDYIEFCNDDNPWIEIKSDEDIEIFYKNFNFHDAYIESVMYASGVIEPDMCHTLIDNSHNMIITFTCWGRRLEMLFTKVYRFSLQGYCNGTLEYFDGNIEFRTDLWGKNRDDRVVVFSECGLAYPSEINLNNACGTFVIADGLKWRFVRK